jgi:hypothetical protein
MALTEAQRVTLATHIRANTDPDVVAALAGRNDTELTRLYNLDSSFIIWKKSVTPDEYRGAMLWTEVDTLNTGAARIWEWVTNNFTSNLNADDSNIRQGIADAFGPSTTTRANLLAVAKRAATVGESVFATGTGTDATPGSLDFVGSLTTGDVGRALNENPGV